jgi:hypothetical protein
VKIDASSLFFLFRIRRRSWFLWIVEDVTAKNKYFIQKRDACHRLSFSPLQKCTTVMKMLAYGGPTDFLHNLIVEYERGVDLSVVQNHE